MNKIQVGNKKLHGINPENLMDYTCEFEIVRNLKVGDQIGQTHIRFRKIAHYEAYINAIDEGYDTEDAISKGYFYKSTPFNLTSLIEVNMAMVVILNMKLLNIEVIIVLYQQKGFVLINVLNS